MKKVTLNNFEYEIIKDYKDVFNYDDLVEKVTDYFDTFDYILGDYSYDKLRLKGFCNKENKNLNDINNYNDIDDYIKNYCSYDCGYYILKKINN